MLQLRHQKKGAIIMTLEEIIMLYLRSSEEVKRQIEEILCISEVLPFSLEPDS